MSSTFTIKKGLKQGDALSLFLVSFSLEYAIRKFQENEEGLKLAYADDINVLGGNMGTIEKNTEAILGKEIGKGKGKATL